MSAIGSGPGGLCGTSVIVSDPMPPAVIDRRPAAPLGSSDIALSLVSHTNAGKTTLARTLLRADVGEVRDAPHVTEFAEVQTMMATPEGERLLLWDTPGFGDSVRLAKRLRQSSQPIGWFLSQVWDRWRDRPFWASQQAMRNLRDEADVMLYLVNAAESPEAAGYIAPEMELLAWVGKPVIALLNQLGPPGAPALEAAELARWRSHLAAHSAVKAVAAARRFRPLLGAGGDVAARRRAGAGWRAAGADGALARGLAARATWRSSTPRCMPSPKAWRAPRWQPCRCPTRRSARRLRSAGARLGLAAPIRRRSRRRRRRSPASSTPTCSPTRRR
jgi:hypothetical protein